MFNDLKKLIQIIRLIQSRQTMTIRLTHNRRKMTRTLRGTKSTQNRKNDESIERDQINVKEKRS